ncbi:MAG: hypothetical protein FWC23_08415 [Chitinispirillia bacterium]|nr:hypothetical protein [Chitinispirillia bacterium]MCL2269191.1 hypothetical protein [Chitinispirillia bacterium]
MHYVYVINVSGQISVAIVDVRLESEVAKVVLNGQLNSPLDAAKMAYSIVNFILKAGPKPPPGYVKPVAEKKGGGGKEKAPEAERADRGGRESAPEAEREYTRHGHSIGTLVGTPYGGFETYWRAGMTKHSRFYTGIGYWEGSRDYWHGNEFNIAAFVEWHTNNNWFNVYGGPGITFGNYNYTLNYNSGGRSSSAGASVGVQTGAELKLGWFLLGTDMRLALYVRRWDTGATGSFGLHTGIAF